MKIIKYFTVIFFLLYNGTLSANEKLFSEWLNNFKIYALDKGISEKTKLTFNFMKRKLAEYEELEKEFKK